MRFGQGHLKDCDSPDFKSETLKLLFEFPFALYFSPPPSKFEASAVALHPHLPEAYVAFDNIYSIARLALPLPFANQTGPPSHLLSWPDEPLDGDSGFEYMSYNKSSGWFLVGREAKRVNNRWHSETIDVRFDHHGELELGKRCITEFEFAKENKGFEGSLVIQVGDEFLLLALCEGNFCEGGKKGRRAGNGRVVLMRRVEHGNSCRWATVDVVPLPPTANFEDYSGMALMGSRVAIVSQSNSALYVGKMEVMEGRLQFSEGRVVDFPRGTGCEVLYCNIEGIAWLDESRIITVSDSMKKGGKQPFQCREKDEMVHMFAIV